MTEEPEEEQQNRSSDNVKSFLKFRGFLFVIASVAVIVLFIAVGSVRQSAGDFLASVLGLAGRTFSPNEVYVGEIPLNPPEKPVNSSAQGKIATGLVNKTGASVAKTAVSVKSTQADSKDKLIGEMNDKINELQAKLNAVSASIQSTVQPVSASTTVIESQAQTQAASQQNPPPIQNPAGEGRILISEIMAGADGNSGYEFIELYNAGSAPVDLTGWSIRKKSSTGSESPLVATSRLSGKIIKPGKYFLLGNENGYQGSVALDIHWPSSYTLAYTNNAVVLYDGSGSRVEEIFWAEIPKGQSFARSGWSGSQFSLSASPTPQNSQSQ